MRAIRFNTALGLLLTGGVLTAAQFVLLSHPTLSHLRLGGTVLTSDSHRGVAEDTPATNCHGESAPRDQAPVNHDCCTIGHLHAMGSASVIIAPAFAVSRVSSPLLQLASIDRTASQTTQFFDTGPSASAVPIRI